MIKENGIYIDKAGRKWDIECLDNLAVGTRVSDGMTELFFFDGAPKVMSPDVFYYEITEYLSPDEYPEEYL